MDDIYTCDDVAEKLGLDVDTVRTMAEEGQLSGFYLGEHWRISRQALRADLMRMRDAIDPPEPVQLAPLTSEQTTLEESTTRAPLKPSPVSMEPEFEYFNISIQLENESDYAGEFKVLMLAEGKDDVWRDFKADTCAVEDHELTIKSHLAPGATKPFFTGSLQAKLGDRLFVTVPRQPGLEEPAEGVFVLDTDADLKLTLTESGILSSKKNTLKFKRL